MVLHKNTRRLRELMGQHDLSLRDVADITGRSYKSVQRWRCKSGTAIPDSVLSVLEAKLESRALSAPRLRGGISADATLEISLALFGVLKDLNSVRSKYGVVLTDKTCRTVDDTLGRLHAVFSDLRYDFASACEHEGITADWDAVLGSLWVDVPEVFATWLSEQRKAGGEK